MTCHDSDIQRKLHRDVRKVSFTTHFRFFVFIIKIDMPFPSCASCVTRICEHPGNVISRSWKYSHRFVWPHRSIRQINKLFYH